MNTEDQNQDFEKLQRLLKLKRYEQPHPRYFNDFSSQVVSRIRAGKAGSRFESAENVAPWLRRLWRFIETQPALSGAVATAACGVMVASVFFMEQSTPQEINFPAVGAPDGAGHLQNDFAATALGNNLAVAPLLVSSTNTAALLTGPNLFDRMPTIQAAPASGLPLRQK
jgi:hypothetical protein